jgi:hypothetical protein
MAQNDSCHLRISLLTCSPGAELYAAWGHTAIRVTDISNGTDNVYNYGTFDSEDPLFLANFTKGIMRYALSSYPFSDFVREYQYYERGVIEQTLQLSCADKQRLYSALQENDKPETRFYNYYFHTDNCTSRARDMIVKNSTGQISFKSILPQPPPTYRNLIHFYLDRAGMPWSKFGIDVLLGSNLDKKLDNYDAMFLPDYLMKAFDSASIGNKPVVTEVRTVLDEPKKEGSKTFFTPLVVFSLLAVLVIMLSFLNQHRFRRFLDVFDVSFFLLLGLLGILLVVLWVIRIDDVCRNNFNLLWALPTHAVAAFVVLKKKSWAKKYFRFTLFLTAVVAAGWWLIPQQLNAAIAPILAIIAVRSWKRAN